MGVNGASKTFSFATWVICILIGCRYPFIEYWQPLLVQSTATCSQPDPQNEQQPRVNHFQLHILGNLSSDWLQTSIYQILAAFTGKKNSNMLTAVS